MNNTPMPMASTSELCMGRLQSVSETRCGKGDAFRCAVTPKVYFSFLGSTVHNLPP